MRRFPVIDLKAPDVPTTLPEDFPINNDLENLGSSPLNFPVLLDWLVKYEASDPNLKEDVEILRDGFTDGFTLFSDVTLKAWEFKNHKSARVLPEVMWQKLAKEVSAGRMAGPFDSPPDLGPLGLRIHGIARLQGNQ